MNCRPLLLLLILLAGIEFVVRGPVRWANRGDEFSTDLTGPYVASRAWIHGLNPYSSDVFWTQAEAIRWSGELPDRLDGFASRTSYPLTSFVLLAPLAPLPWSSGRMVAMAFMTLLVLGTILALASLPAWRQSASRRCLFVALAVGLAPLQSAIGAGNLAAAAVALTVMGVWAALHGKQVHAGAALALAVCFKPPIAVPVLGYYFVRRRWRIVAAAIVVSAAVLATGMLRLRVAEVPWFADYLHNNGLVVADHGGAIFRDNFSELQFVNLQYLGHMLFGDNARAANLLALSIGAGLLVSWLMLLSRRDERSELLEISTIAVISLLPVYHRVYDAGLLLLPLCWILTDSQTRTRWPRRFILLLFLPFFVPASTLLELQVAAGRFPDWLAGNWWWNAVVIPHQVWALMGMSVALLAAQALTRTPADA